MAINEMKLHGTKKSDSPVVEEVDFFAEKSGIDVDVSSIIPKKNVISEPLILTDGPTVDFSLSSEKQPNDTVQLANKTKPTSRDKPWSDSSIGSEPVLVMSRAKKSGLGAAKVKTDFAAIESAAEKADLQKERQEILSKKLAQEKADKTAEDMASVRLAYKELTREQAPPQDNPLKTTDPTKAAQVERLGMSSNRLGSRNIEHSAFSSMQIIEQEGLKDTTKASSIMSSNLDPFMLYSGDERQHNLMSSSRNIGDNWLENASKESFWNKDDDIFSSLSKSSAVTRENRMSSNGNRSQTYNDRNTSWSNRDREPSNPVTSDEFMKKFANATSISSAAVFNQDESRNDGDASSRFQSNTAISSDDYFGRTPSRPPANQLPSELQNIKEGVRQGMVKVTSRLSNMASDVVSHLEKRLHERANQ